MHKNNRTTLYARHQRGVTLIELLVALIVLGIAVSIAVPSYRSLVSGNDLRSTTRAMVTALQLARSQALSFRQDVSLSITTGANNSANGWQLKTADDERRWRLKSGINLTVTGLTNDKLTFVGRSGFLQGSAATFTFCASSSGSNGKKVSVGKSGLVETTDATCS